MKHRSSFRKVVFILIGIVILGLMGMGFIKSSSYYQTADRNFFSFVSMLRYGLVEKPIQTIGNVVEDTSTMWDVRYENDQLRTQLETSYQWQSRLDELQREVNELKELNNLNALHSDMTQINATVKSRSAEKWDSVITIDKGTADGIAVNDGVMASKGIIGRVIQSSENQSLVSLLIANDDYSSVTVQIEVSPGNYVQGILDSYDAQKGLFKIELLEATSTVAADMNVTTSNISSVYPSGLTVGTVDSVKNVADKVGVLVYVKPNVNFNDLNYVTVVKK